MWWWAPTNAHHCAIQPTITQEATWHQVLWPDTNAVDHYTKFSIITQKFPGGPFKFQEISRISRSCRHPGLSVLELKTRMKVIGLWCRKHSTKIKGRPKRTWKQVVSNDLKCLYVCLSDALQCKKCRKLIKGRQSHSDDESGDSGSPHWALFLRPFPYPYCSLDL